jgi:hypothetical protein
MRRALLHAVVLVTAACGGGAGRADTARQDSARADSSVQADERCVRGEPEPALTASGSATRPRFERRGKLDAIEDVRLDDTTALRITHAGCAHYVQRYEFTVRGAVRDTADTRYWLMRGAEYLETLATVENVRAQISDMVKGLRGAASAPPAYAYGDPIRASELAHVYFSVRGAGPRAVVIEIVYDYAL